MHTTPVLRVLAAWLLTLMLVGAGFIAAVSVLNGRLYSPEHQVGLYLEALQEGDGGRALGLLNAAVPDGANPTLLDGEALRRASASLDGITVGEARGTADDQVDVPVTYTVDGAEHSTVFPLRRTNTEWLFFGVWQFEPTVLPTVEVLARNSIEAAVNGVDVGLPGGATAMASFYPAVIDATYEDEYVTAPARHAVVTGSKAPPPPLALETEPTQEMTQTVNDQLRSFLDGCAGQTVFQPTNCPFAYPTNERLAGDIVWSIEKYPSAVITPDDGGWALAPLSGTARIDTQLRDFQSGTVRNMSEAVPFEFDAELLVTDGAVTVTPVVRY